MLEFRRAAPLLTVALVLSAVLAVVRPGSAAPAPSPAASAAPVSQPTTPGDAGAPAPPIERNPEASELARTRARVADLLANKLDVGIDPQTLFPVSLEDEPAFRVEVERLRAIVARAVAPADKEVDAGPPRASRPATATAPTSPQRADAGTVDAGADRIAAVPSTPLDPALWKAQVELDRARLAFLSLPLARRAALLAAHAERQKAATDDSQSRLTEAERKTQAAEEERQRALEAARKARTEAARAVAEEHARLLSVAKAQAEFEETLVRREKAAEPGQEKLLALQRQVREALDAARTTALDAADADVLYEEVRTALRGARDALSTALSELSAGGPAVPAPGEDRLAELPVDIDRRQVDEVRARVARVGKKLAERQEEFLEDRAKRLYDVVVTLNSDRLALLPYLSAAKRDAVRGIGPSGFAQAANEIRQVVLILRYHLSATTRWIAEIRVRRAVQGRSAFTATLVAAAWLLPLVALIWWRRRAPAVLESVKRTLDEGTRKGGRRPPAPTPAERTLQWFTRVRGALEWLAWLVAILWLLPEGVAELLEVKLVSTVLLWTLSGSVIVQTIDFLAGAEGDRRHRRSTLQTAHIRRRSLRLVGRVVVGLGLVLSLSDQLVGKGTLYDWVVDICWIAGFVIVLVLVRWWRAVIFERVETKRKPGPIDRWVAGNREGWKSFVAALLGGAMLLGGGVVRVVRTRVAALEVTRRVLAYLFSREISRKAEAHAKIAFRSIDRDVFRKLGPSSPSEELVPSVADAQITEVIDIIDSPGGGVFALVGERGAGKTTMLQRIAKEANDATMMRCPFGGMERFAPAFVHALGADEGAVLETVAEQFDAEERDAAILIDDAHRLIRPMIGGLRAFDRVLAIARHNSQRIAWVFAFDEVIWRFFEGMRGARPIFDDVIHLKPWDEEAVARLLGERSRTVGLEPTFSHLLSDLPADADDLDVEDALERTAAGYYRLIWDYAAGNPGVALHVWRHSLGVAPEGQTAVKVFSAPKSESLEDLPDSAVFVLRALIQLETASAEELCRATGIGLSEVENVLRFGSVRGYFVQTDAGYRVTWAWFRAITRFLQRRHLLFPA